MLLVIGEYFAGRVCEIESVDNSNISTYCVHECEGVSRVGMRSRRFIFTGHVNGSVQVSIVSESDLYLL